MGDRMGEEEGKGLSRRGSRADPGTIRPAPVCRQTQHPRLLLKESSGGRSPGGKEIEENEISELEADRRKKSARMKDRRDRGP